MSFGDPGRKPVPPEDIRFLCYRVGIEMRSKPRRLDTICPKPDETSLEPTRRDLNRVLVEDPDWYCNFPAKASDDRWKSAELEIVLDDLIVKVCRFGHSPAFAWSAILEMIEAGVMAAEIRQPRVEGYYDRDSGEGRVILKVTREGVRDYFAGDQGMGESHENSTIKATVSESWENRLSVFRAKQPNHLQDQLDIIIELLRKEGNRLTQERLFGLSGRRLSEGPAKRLLSAAVTENILTNRSNPKPRGYGLPEWDLK